MKKSIRNKLLIGAILPVILGILVLIIVSVILVKSNVNRMTNQVLASQTSDLYYKIDGYFGKYIASINTYSNTDEIANVFTKVNKDNGFNAYSDKMKLVKELAKFKAEYADISNYWIADLDSSELIYDNGIVVDGDYKLNEQEWFKELMIKKETTLTSPYISKSSGKEVISIVTMVKLNAFQNIGVVGVDIPTEVFMQRVEEYRNANDNNLTLITEDGMILYDDMNDIIGHELHTTSMDSKIIAAFDSKSVGDINYVQNSENYIGSILKSDITGITLITGIEKKAFSKSVNSLIIFLISIGSAILICVIIVIILVAKGIISPIKYLERISNEIADGNLEVQIEYEEENEIGRLANSLQKTVARLNMYIKYIDEVAFNLDKISNGDLNISIDNEVEGAFLKIQNSLDNIRIKLSMTIGEVVNSSEEISSSAQQLTDGAQSLSESSVEQASSVDLLSESIINITEQINNTTEYTNKSYNISNDTLDTAELGNEQMKNLVESMNEIMIISNKIGKIVHTIEDIAFQTNTLSLNASIEAARAGDAGRGFSVVAGEVRKLANKTSEAAKETSDLIKSSISSVVKGNRLCGATSKSLEEILEFIQLQADIVEKIDKAAKEQKSSINEIEESIINISGAVQTNSATAEEAAAASENLYYKSKDMYAMVEEFVLYDYSERELDEEGNPIDLYISENILVQNEETETYLEKDMAEDYVEHNIEEDYLVDNYVDEGEAKKAEEYHDKSEEQNEETETYLEKDMAEDYVEHNIEEDYLVDNYVDEGEVKKEEEYHDKSEEQNEEIEKDLL